MKNILILILVSTFISCEKETIEPKKPNTPAPVVNSCKLNYNQQCIYNYNVNGNNIGQCTNYTNNCNRNCGQH